MLKEQLKILRLSNPRLPTLGEARVGTEQRLGVQAVSPGEGLDDNNSALIGHH